VAVAVAVAVAVEAVVVVKYLHMPVGHKRVSTYLCIYVRIQVGNLPFTRILMHT
jgi:hypothetical protein